MIGYLDLPSGISGDMFLGCLVDAGWPLEQLKEVLARLKLPADSWVIDARHVMKGAIRATLVDVRVKEGMQLEPVSVAGPILGHHRHHPHDHDHPHDQAQGHHHHGEQGHEHAHGGAGGGGHAHRNLEDIRGIIGAADLPKTVKDRAVAVFTRLAHAEAKVHGTSVEAIHFHEVGALDAIVDIVGVVAGVEAMGIGQLYVSPLPLGPGYVKSAHGQIPLPAPATLELLASAGAPTRPAPGPGELVTPTGAALVAEMGSFKQPEMRLERIGLGAGQKDFDWPNIARLWLGSELPQAVGGEASAETFVEIETNIDDMNPQLYAAVAERLFAAGALDVWMTPMQMKKNRPGIMLSVLAPAAAEKVLAEVILRETTTLGVRVRTCRRHEVRREFAVVCTRHGEVRVKLKFVGDQVCGAAPEYDDCRKVAEAAGVAVRAVYEEAMAMGQAEFLQR